MNARLWARIMVLLGALMLGGCVASPPPMASSGQIADLAAEIARLSPHIDRAEAAQAAQLAFVTSHALARAYQITDPPLIHNAKVNAGTKPRGLCYHWAEDLQARLDAAGFATLDTRRAIANADNRILIDHSTVVLVAKGAPMESGIILDPWRHGGRLFWSPVAEDKRYKWQRREDVLRTRGQIRQAHDTPRPVAAPPAD